MLIKIPLALRSTDSNCGLIIASGVTILIGSAGESSEEPRTISESGLTGLELNLGRRSIGLISHQEASDIQVRGSPIILGFEKLLLKVLRRSAINFWEKF